MNLMEFAAWRDVVGAYWIDEFELSGYSNTSSLLDQVWSKLDVLQVERDRYVDSLVDMVFEESSFKIFLLQLMGYVALRLNTITPDEEDIGIPELIPGDDLRSLVQAYGFVLPEPDGLFTIENAVEPEGYGVLMEADGYVALLASLTGMSNIHDALALNDFMEGFASAAFDKSLYLAYASPPITQGLTKDIKTYIREDMHLLDLMEFANMSIFGVNHHYYLPDGTRADTEIP